MKRCLFLSLFLVLFLSAFASRKSDEPTIKVISPEEFFSVDYSDKQKCFSCVTVEGELIDYCLIKGNINKKNRIYHCPNWRDYGKTKIDLSKGERYFYTEEEAVSNGWREAEYYRDDCQIGLPMR